MPRLTVNPPVTMGYLVSCKNLSLYSRMQVMITLVEWWRESL